MKNWLFLILISVFTLPLYANAYPFSVNYDSGTKQTTGGVDGYKTTGAMMDGMAVTAYFSDQTSETVFWTKTGDTSGGVSGQGAYDWSLSEIGNTHIGRWTLSLDTDADISITGLFFDAGQGDAVFDTDRYGNTANTGNYKESLPFTIKSASEHISIDAFYRDIVAINDSDPAGDLYRTLEIKFTNEEGFRSGDILTYVADTDNLSLAGDIHPANTTVPEPGTVILMGLGLTGLVGIRWKFRKQACSGR